MSDIFINACSSICSLGDSIEEIFKNAISSENQEFIESDDNIITSKTFYFGKIHTELPQIQDEEYNIRCNRILLHCCIQLKNDIEKAIEKYGKNRIGIVIGNTNAGVDEFEKSNDIRHSEIGNPAGFLKKYLGLKGFCCGVSTACTSGLKAFSTAKKLLDSNICDAVIAGAVDELCKMPSYGFHSLEVFSDKRTIPFSQNRSGINIGEGGALFLLEKTPKENAIEVLGIGETSDAYHCATPDPDGIEAARAMEIALKEANLRVSDIDYINLHGTGTLSNDLMEANAVFKVFKDSVFVSSTKSLTGHCLGASAGVETALCVAMLDKKINPNRFLLPHKYDGEYDSALPKLKLAGYNEKVNNLKYCMCNAFGFGGSNAVIILGSYDNEKI